MPYYIESETYGLLIGFTPYHFVFQAAQMTDYLGNPVTPIHFKHKEEAEEIIEAMPKQHDCCIVFMGTS